LSIILRAAGKSNSAVTATWLGTHCQVGLAFLIGDRFGDVKRGIDDRLQNSQR
jgi:hypothetical protein